jgi:hypothetical protein
MSQSDAAVRYLSWLRRGAASQIPTADGAAGVARAALPVSLRFAGVAQPATVTLELLGPGDISGFDARAIARVWPPAGTLDAESNYFPLVEFDEPDLPWRYTPRKADASGRLRPWCALVVVMQAELVGDEAPRPDRALDAITIAAGTPMPDVQQAWAWAHVQVSGDDGTALASVVANAPERCRARLLCPRRLHANTTYVACLVPTFEVGRLAGLRLPIGAASDALAPAWTVTNGVLAAPLQLPVYHRWQFATGAGGDFESLVAKLEPHELPASAGVRALDASAPGGDLPPAAAEPLMLGGALRSPDADDGVTPDPAFVGALAKLLNLPADVKANGGDPVVAPPLYGTWHALRARLEPTEQPPWFHTLNADPTLRVPAALGALVVQDQQAELMASAWDQVDGIREANTQLRSAQLARAIGQRLHARFIQSTQTDQLLQLVAPLHGHTKAGAMTVMNRVRHSPHRSALFSPPLRRLWRARGPLGRRQARPDVPAAPMIARLNDGGYDHVLVAAPPPPRATTHEWVAKLFPSRGWPLAADEIQDAPKQPRIVAWDPALGGEPPSRPLGEADDSPSMAAFRAAATEFARRELLPEEGETLTRLSLSALRTAVLAATDPAVTIPAGLRRRLAGVLSFPWNPPDPIDPVMAYPVFPEPMYASLAARSPDWLLPGLSDVKPNKVTLAETNDAFIEAYLVGLNHEMARELLWNEYPTDQRGSYFRQFWDPAGVVPRPTPETAKDITPLHTWSQTSTLGSHSPRPPGPDGKHLVLVVRSEVLRRYPNTLVYAQRAQFVDGVYRLGSEQRRPVFGGRLPPDVAFFGFELGKAIARGSGTPEDPGWFVVFEEQPHEPRFGLDIGDADDTGAAPAKWDDLAWPHLVAPGHSSDELGYIDLAAELPHTAALEVVGGFGWHLSAAGAGRPFARGADHAAITQQRPVRVAMHARQMLLS